MVERVQDRPFERAAEAQRLWLFLTPALLLLLAQAFLPLHQFIHRGDDAFYYFKVAANYPKYGFWTFDGIHSTNGVQPLWAILLTVVAQILYGVGVRDPDTLARIFVALTALLHFLSCAMLFRLLARTVSVGTAVAAAGGLLYSMGVAWTHVWGMENSLYALLLISTVSYFHFTFLKRPTVRHAALLGALLGLTALCRLNAGLFAVCLLGYYLLLHRQREWGARLRLTAVAALTAGVVLLPYFLGNYLTTGHLLPISGAVKSVLTAQLMENNHISGRFSTDYLRLLLEQGKRPLTNFVAEHGADSLWLLGARCCTDNAIPPKFLLPAFAGLLIAPFLFARKTWLALLRSRFARLSAFVYVLAFAMLDTLICVFLYPTQIGYAMTRWWLVPDEIVIVVLGATLTTAILHCFTERFLPRPQAGRLLEAALVLFFVFHAAQMASFYGREKTTFREWNRSWNDESLRAAQWMTQNLPADALVGSWNAGVVGYYAKQRVVNLDGLINNFDYLPYLKANRTDAYILRERIQYLSDIETMFPAYKLDERLRLTPVYCRYNPLMQKYYCIYRVDGPMTPGDLQPQVSPR